MTLDKSQFIFFDEGVDPHFTAAASKFIVLSSVCFRQCEQDIMSDYWKLKHELFINLPQKSTKKSFKNKRFHASEDPQKIRNEVFNIINLHKCKIQARVIIIEKGNVFEYLKHDEWIYKKLYYYLLKDILFNSNWVENYNNLQLITDKPPTIKLGKSIMHGIKTAISNTGKITSYNIHNMSSSEHPFLQFTDYVTWAVLKKYSSNGKDLRSYNKILDVIENEWKII